MKNGSIIEQLKMQEQELREPKLSITDEKENKQENIQIPDFESKFANSQNVKLEDFQTVNQEDKQSPTSTDFGLSSALELLTPDVSNQEGEQQPVKIKKKKPKQGFRQS